MGGAAAVLASAARRGASSDGWVAVAAYCGAMVVCAILYFLPMWLRSARSRRDPTRLIVVPTVSRDSDPDVRRFADAVARGDFEEAERTARWVFFASGSPADSPPNG